MTSLGFTRDVPTPAEIQHYRETMGRVPSYVYVCDICGRRIYGHGTHTTAHRRVCPSV